MRTTVGLLLALSMAGAISAQVRPQAGSGDAHIQTIAFKANQVVQLDASLGYALMVELAPDEQIQTVAVGDSATWQVTVNHAGNQLFIKPQQMGGDTNMTVVTSVRLYHFTLSASGGGQPSAYTVRFTYPPPTASISTGEMSGLYQLSGERALRPSAIGDDGHRTYIVWPRDALLPATYVLDDDGNEALANGEMRDGMYVLDGVNTHLLFRIDSKTARADRRPDKKKRG